MKRKYEVLRVDDAGGFLSVTVAVHSAGAMWSLQCRIPAEMLADHEIYDAITRMVHNHHMWEHRQRERLDDSLF